MYLIAEVSFAVLSERAPEITSGSSSSDTPITDFNLITSSSDALYSLSSPWTASATLGKGLHREGEEKRGVGRDGGCESGCMVSGYMEICTVVSRKQRAHCG